jgi:hypothetical protein
MEVQVTEVQAGGTSKILSKPGMHWLHNLLNAFMLQSIDSQPLHARKKKAKFEISKET